MSFYEMFNVINGALQLKNKIDCVDYAKIKNKNKIYYVYVYMDPRKNGHYFWEDYVFPCEPFYIGKGKEKRVLSHLENAIYNRKDCNQYKINKIKKIIKETCAHPIFGKFIINLYEEEALYLEKQIINDLQRSYNCLTNIADGGIGGDTISKNPNKDKISQKISLKLRGFTWEEKMGKEKANERREKKKINDLYNPNAGMKGKHHTEENKPKHACKGEKNGMYGKGLDRVGEKNTFYGKRHSEKTKKSIGDKNRKYFNIDEEKVEELYKLGFSLGEVANILKTSSFPVKKILINKNILKRNKRSGSFSDIKKRKELFSTFMLGGVTYDELVEKRKQQFNSN